MKIWHIVALFHEVGSWPSLCDCVKRCVCIGAISSAASFSKRAGSLSGPPAFEGFILLKMFCYSNASKGYVRHIRMCGSDLGKSF